MLWWLLFSFHTAALKRLNCHRADSFWQTTISQPSQAFASGWVLCCERGVQSDDVCVTDCTFTLTRAPSPAPCPVADVTIPSPHTYAFTQTHAWNVSALPLSLNHYLPLFTFLFLPKKQYQTSCSPHWIHTHVHTHINTGPTSRLMLIWHHQRGV